MAKVTGSVFPPSYGSGSLLKLVDTEREKTSDSYCENSYCKGKPMLSNFMNRNLLFVLVLVAAFHGAPGHAQSALLMEEPYGFFGAVNPTGHNAIYFERICAATPVKLRRCE